MTFDISLRDKLNTAFRPHAPIEDPSSFIGRVSERESVIDAIYQPGLQVVIFGERGAGKTSLANICTNGLPRIQIFAEQNSNSADIFKNIALQYKNISPSRIIYNALNDTIEVEGSIYPTNKLTGNLLRQILSEKDSLCIIVDEIDRVLDKNAIAQLAELAKNLSTYHTNITLILIGVANTADDLLEGHASNFRNIRQVSLDRMTVSELLGIIAHGEEVLSLSFDNDVKTKITEICDRLPYYLHLLATNAAKIAYNRNSTIVTNNDLVEGMKLAAADADQTLRQVYEHAIASAKRSQIYRQILWAIANLPGQSHTVATVADEVNKISMKESSKNISIQSVGQALKKLTEDDKKRILSTKLIGKTAAAYYFTNPLMKGFVRIIQEQR